jgi:hypothetical protein
MRKLPMLVAIIALLALSPAACALFEMRSLDIAITLNNDGSAHATESVRLFITDNQSVQLYEESKVFNDISTWSNRTGIKDIGTHVDWTMVKIDNLKVRSQPKYSCNTVSGSCYGMLEVDYDIYQLSNGQGGLQRLVTYKPRTTKYTLQSKAFTFPQTKTGDILLPSGTSLRIQVPEDALRISFSKAPSNLENETAKFRYDSSSGSTYYLGSQKQFVWEYSTDQTLSQFSLAYEREESLEAEVISFFSVMQARAFELAFSQDGLIYAFIAAVLLISVLWINSLGIK